MNLLKFFAPVTALFLLCSCESGVVSLSFNTQNAPKQKLTLESNMKVIVNDSAAETPEAMETHLISRFILTQTMAFDNGDARFALNVDSIDYKSDKRTIEEYRDIEKYLAQQNYQFKMTKDGSISEPSVEDQALQPGTEELDLMKFFMKIQPNLPGSPVAKGATWDRTLQIPGKNGVTSVYKSFTLDDVYIHDGIQMAKILMNIKYQEFPDTNATVRMESNDFIVGQGHVLFDMTHGVISSAALEISGDLQIHDVISAQIFPHMRVFQKIELRGELE